MPKHPAKNPIRTSNKKRGRSAADSSRTPARCPGTKGRPPREAFLPISRADMDARGWDRCDFVYVCGDAYVDHPSFGMAIITRVLEAHGYRVGIICQPDWTDPASIAALGEPRLGFLVSAGNMDSMVNHYTVNKKPRHEDAYTPGGVAGARPNRAVTVYGNLIRRTFKDKPIIIGGIEASLRRLAHYDYWQDKLKSSVLLDSGADILLYGMGEHSIVEVADALDGGLPVDQITFVNGSAYRVSGPDALDNVCDYELLPSWDDLTADRLTYARSFNIQQQNMDPITAKRLVEPYPNGVYVVQNPPAAPLTTAEMDEVSELPYAATGTPTTTRPVASPPSTKSVSPSAVIAAASASARFARWPSIRAACCRSAAARASSAKPRRSRATPSSRATSTTWADPPRTSSNPHAKSSSRTAYARTAAACGQACAATWTRMRTPTPSSCATYGSSPA